MARPAKYNWELIKKAYEEGIDVDTIADEYSITKKTLQNKISEEKWTISGTLNADIKEFEDVLGKISRNTENDPIKQKIAIEKITTILEDNGLIQNNRKLLKLAQSIIVRDRDQINYKNIRNLTAAVRDIEAVVNPRANEQNVTVNTAISATAVATATTQEEASKVYLDLIGR